MPFDFASLRAACAVDRTAAETVEQIYARIEDLGDPGILLHLLGTIPRDDG